MPIDVSLEPPQGIRRMIDTLDNVVRSTANYAAEGKLRRHLIAQSG